MLYFIAAIVLIGVYLIFSNRKKTLSINSQQKSNYTKLLAEHVAFYQKLSPTQQQNFLLRMEGFLQETKIEGVGLALEDLDKVLIAASAIIPIFGFKDWRYTNLTSIILYPDTFNNDFQFEGGKREIAGMVGSGFMNGQMLLSRAALRKGFSALAGENNTAIHEFVHLLDKGDGATDGLPEQLIPHEYAAPWVKLMHQEIKKIEAGKSEIDVYASTNEAEFFAVAAEYFFEKPEKFRQKHPELYELLCRIFLQNPA
ncbi:MAG: zinc-dependent peptidase [Sphingobacteriaceae bacterium]|nr:MAG: zinc-dependent peptidase [Sphingobacteriaceae bacterium]